MKGRKIRLACFGTEAGKFRQINADREVALRLRIIEGLERLAGLIAHGKDNEMQKNIAYPIPRDLGSDSRRPHSSIIPLSAIPNQHLTPQIP